MGTATALRPPPVRLGQGRTREHVGVRLVLVLGAAAIVAMWWLDPAPLGNLGAEVTAAGRLAGLLGAYLVLVQLLLMAGWPGSSGPSASTG